MIDTISIQVKLNVKHYSLLKEKIEENELPLTYIQNYYKKEKQVSYVGNFNEYSVRYDPKWNYIFIHVNPRHILKHTPSEKDCTEIENKVIDFLKNKLFLCDITPSMLEINRIDYKVDYKTKNEEEMQIFYDLKSIATDKIGNIIKTEYATAVTFNPKNGYTQVMTYNKEEEQRKKHLNKNYKSKGQENYYGVIRTECRIKNRKLNYYKKKRTKHLKNYLNEEMATMFFEKYVTKVWFSSPFYRIDIALDKIKKSSSITDNMKGKLCLLIYIIHYGGFSFAKYWYCSYYTSRTFDSHIKLLEKMGINPLTFSEKYSQEKMENFSVRKKA